MPGVTLVLRECSDGSVEGVFVERDLATMPLTLSGMEYHVPPPPESERLR